MRFIACDASIEMRKILLFISALLLYAVSVLAITPAEAVEKFASYSGLQADKCAVAVIDLSSGKSIGSHNASVPLVPASVTKAVSIATLLEKTGADYHYFTKIYTLGDIKDGTLVGDVLIEGGGDPSLGSSKEPVGTNIVAECVEALKKHGITTIQGRIKTDSSFFPLPATPPSWENADRKTYYGAGCFGLNFENNASGKSSVSDPAGVLCSRLESACRAAGITIQGEDVAQSGHKKMIVNHVSPQIDEIMRSCMMRSDNMYAETFIRTYAKLLNREASSGVGAEEELKYWRKRKLPVDGVTLVDGSGLSRRNRLTADFLARLLVAMSDNVDYVSFFPLAGQEGTLRNFLRDTPLDSYIAMKTGSMRGVQCYAGYMLDEEFAPTHVVVVLINDFTACREAVKDAVKTMLLEIFTSDDNSIQS